MAEDGLDRAIEAIGRMSLQALVPHGARKRVFGTVYRICRLRYAAAWFRALYTSLSLKTARLRLQRYFQRRRGGGFAEASIALRLKRVVDLTNTRLLRKSGIEWGQLIGTR